MRNIVSFCIDVKVARSAKDKSTGYRKQKGSPLPPPPPHPSLASSLLPLHDRHNTTNKHTMNLLAEWGGQTLKYSARGHQGHH